MHKIVSIIIEALFWTAIFLSPVLFTCVIAIIVYVSNSDNIEISALIVSTGILAGAFWSEKIRRKYGCANYWGNILSTPDIWPIPKEKIKANNQEDRAKK